MIESAYKYVIVGGGLAGAMAVAGIRELDTAGSILLLGSERHLPYNRPPLTKRLWYGQTTVEQIPVFPASYYAEHGVKLMLGNTVTSLIPAAKCLTDSQGNSYQFEKLLLATGGIPRTLSIPGGDLAGVVYYRVLDDYLEVRALANPGARAVIIGGGFIGSEMAAALQAQGMQVTMVFPEANILSRVLPEPLAHALSERLRAHGVTLLAGDMPVSISAGGQQYTVQTHSGQTLITDLVLVGIGITPATSLAQTAGLAVDNGIQVDEFTLTTHPDIFAAGDNANFPYVALGERRRIEHWDHAAKQGRQAGRNMAGANEPYHYLPVFYTSVLDFFAEAVGDIDARLETYADWRRENDTGVVYYLKEGRVRGVLLCNVPERVDQARALITSGEARTRESLHGAI